MAVASKGTSIEYTPTWALATVYFFFIFTAVYLRVDASGICITFIGYNPRFYIQILHISQASRHHASMLQHPNQPEKKKLLSTL